jgi:Ca2+-binding EF-hand superfamily protein
LGDDEAEPNSDANADISMFDPSAIFKTMFDKFDTDKSGTISMSECKSLLEKLGVPWFLASVAFNKIDADKSGSLTVQEFTDAFGGLLGLKK